MSTAAPTSRLLFGAFELDLATSELRRSGSVVRLPPQPLKVLALLAGRPGELVTREELRAHLWGEETFVDFDRGLNFCVNQVRAALGDDADAPRFVETLPRRGYRFIAPVAGLPTPATSPAAVVPSPAEASAGPPPSVPRRPRRAWAVTMAAVTIGLALAAAYLRRPPSGSVAPAARRMLVVLPFTNLTGDPEQEFLSDGVTEELTTQLAGLPREQLGVIARTSAMKYKGTKTAVDQIGRELGVDYVLEGSVRRGAGRLRITAQLIDARTQAHLWAENYERELRDILALEREVTSAIAGEIRLQLTPQQRQRLADVRPVDVEAHEMYLRGRHLWNERSPPALQQAIELFSEAAEKDPQYALPHAGLADCYVLLHQHGLLTPAASFPRARDEAQAALDLDPTLAEPLASRALVRFLFDWDWAGAERDFLKSIELNPSQATAHQWYAELLTATGRTEAALSELGRARELDPLSRIVSAASGRPFYYARRQDEAIARFRSAVEMDPSFLVAHALLGRALEAKGRHADALAELDQALVLGPEEPNAVAEHAAVLAKLGRRPEALEGLARLEALSRRRYVPQYLFVVVYAALGDTQAASASLARAAEQRDPDLVHLAVDPRVDGVRQDARFQAVLARLALPR